MSSYRHTAGVRWYRVFLAAAAMTGVVASPVPKTTYDQTQHGELNVRADLDNILVLFVPSGGIRLIDNQQIGNILQLFSNSRKNSPNEASSAAVLGGSNDSPYKVDVEQSAIDRLQSDVDSLNTVIPITKNLGLEKKDIDQLPTDDKVSANVAAEDAVRADNSTEPEVVPVRTTDEKQSEQSTRETETSKPSTTQDATTVESIVTSQPITQKVDKKEPTDTENKDGARAKTSTKSSTHKEEKPSAVTHKAHQRTAQSSHQSQKSHQNAKPAFVAGPVKRSDEEEDRLAKRLRSIQSGLAHCSPGETLAETGDCVKVPEKTTDRERRQEKMDRLLELLRFGLQPAGGSQ